MSTLFSFLDNHFMRSFTMLHDISYIRSESIIRDTHSINYQPKFCNKKRRNEIERTVSDENPERIEVTEESCIEADETRMRMDNVKLTPRVSLAKEMSARAGEGRRRGVFLSSN